MWQGYNSTATLFSAAVWRQLVPLDSKRAVSLLLWWGWCFHWSVYSSICFIFCCADSNAQCSCLKYRGHWPRSLKQSNWTRLSVMIYPTSVWDDSQISGGTNRTWRKKGGRGKQTDIKREPESVSTSPNLRQISMVNIANGSFLFVAWRDECCYKQWDCSAVLVFKQIQSVWNRVDCQCSKKKKKKKHKRG